MKTNDLTNRTGLSWVRNVGWKLKRAQNLQNNKLQNVRGIQNKESKCKMEGKTKVENGWEELEPEKDTQRKEKENIKREEWDKEN